MKIINIIKQIIRNIESNFDTQYNSMTPEERANFLVRVFNLWQI